MWNTLIKFLKDTLVWGLLIFCMGYIWFLESNKQDTNPHIVERVIEKPVIHETVRKEVVTQVQVKEKEHFNDPDIIMDTEDNIKVSLNGREVLLKPKGDDDFNFKDNYIELKQQSSYNIDINNKPLEPSWSIGVGYSSNKRVAGIATARIKDTPLHIWGMSDGKDSAVGIMFSTNYK